MDGCSGASIRKARLFFLSADALETVEADDALAALKAKMGVAPAAQAAPIQHEQQSLEEIEKQIEAELAAKR